jgi:cell division protease FtsH
LNKSNNPLKNKKNEPKGKFNPYWVYGAILVFFLVGQFYSSFQMGAKDTSYQQFENEFLKNDDVSKIVIVNKNIAQIYIKEEKLENNDAYKDVKQGPLGEGINPGPHYQFEIGDLQNFENKLEKEKQNNNLDFTVEYDTQKDVWGDLLGWLLPIVLMIAVWIFIMRRMSGGAGGAGGGQIFNIGKSKAKLFDQDSEVKTTFENVAGLEGAKEEVEEIVSFLKEPEKYTSLGGKIPKGALLVGPPGTGKTLLAKAVAGEAKVPFYSLSGSDFVEMFVGVGASRVRDLFKQAKEKSPAIIFIDEIDAIGRARGKNQITGGNDERENTLNQLLTEMDGFETDNHVIVLAATNRADVLDKALLRAGRFDRQIFVDLPDLNERQGIFKVHLKPIKMVEDLDIEFLAKQTPGFSGADIANVCNEAALIAARNNKKAVDKQDFLDAVDRIIGGLEMKNKIITVLEKKTIAYHESGHATVSWLLEHAAPLVKVTIVPRGQSLGAAWYLPEERQITTEEQILDEMCATLAGRAAEQVVFGKVSTGALNDLEKVTKQARALVTVYGLNDKIGNVTYYDSSGQGEYNFTKPYSESTAQIIDKEIKTLIDTQYKRAIDIIKDNVDKLTQLAEALLKDEVIFKENLLKIFGDRPHDKNRLSDLDEDKDEGKEEGEIKVEDTNTSTQEVSDSKS